MANRQGDVDLRFAQVSAPQLELWFGLAWLGLAWLGLAWHEYSFNAHIKKKQDQEVNRHRNEQARRIAGTSTSR
jgi:hypothetical protein